MANGNGIIGRIKEIAIFRRLLSNVLKGGNQILLLAGEAGIGKSMLAEKFADIASESGFAVICGYWRENCFLPEYRGLSSFLHNLVCEAENMEVANSSLMYPVGFISKVREYFSIESPSPESTDIMQLVYHYAVKLLENISLKKPCLLVFENIDFAGNPTLAFIENIIHEFPGEKILFLLTYRPGLVISEKNEFYPVISGIKKEKLCTEITVPPLSLFETEMLVSAITGTFAEERLVSRIYRATKGNPFFVREAAILCCRGRAGRHGISDTLWENEMPSAVAGLICRRLSALGEECVEMIKKAAVIGECFTLTELKMVCGQARGHKLQECLETASAAGFLSYSASSSSSFSFSHSVIHSSIVSMVPATMLQKLNRVLAENTEKAAGEITREKALKLACWWKRSGLPMSDEKARDYLEIAGDIAFREGYWEEAADIYEKLVDEGLQYSEREINEYEASVLLKIGKARFRTGTRINAIPALRKAFIHYRDIKNMEKMAEIAGLAGYVATGEPGFFNLYDELLGIVSSDESLKALSLKSKVLLSYGFNQISCLGNYEEGFRNFDRAFRAAQSCNDTLGQMRALLGIMYNYYHHNDYSAALDCLEKASFYLQKNPDLFSESHIHCGKVIIRIRQGRYREVLDDMEKVMELSDRMNDSYFIAMACYHKSRTEQMDGLWAEAAKTIEKGLNASPSHMFLLASKVFMEYTTGNYEEGDFYRKRILSLHRKTPSGPYLAHLHAASTEAVRAVNSGSTEALKQWIPVLKGFITRPGCHPFLRIRAQLLLFFYSYLLCEPEIGKPGYSAFNKDCRCNMIRPYLVYRFRGLGEHACGNYSHAAALLEKAFSYSVFIGDSPLSACISFELEEARFAAASVSSCDPEKNLSLVRHNLAVCRKNASALGLEGLEKRILDFMAKTGSLFFSASGAVSLLSAREKEILSLLVDGLTNHEIAERAGISFNTVANHVKNILRKTGAANRTQAASFAREERLI